MSARKLLRARSMVLVAVAWVLACGDGPTYPIVEENPDIRSFVIGAAADALDGDGRFLMAADVRPGPENVAIISASLARELATAFTTSYGPSFRPFWEKDRGGAIDLAALTVSTRVYPAMTAFGPVPQVGCHPAHVRVFGSYYLMTMDRGSEQQVRMAVSAQLTDFSVASDGNLVEPPRTGQDFVHEGVRRDRSVALLLSPEQAVAMVARATGAKVDQVPQMVLQNNSEYSPNFALWRVDLDRAVVVLGTGGARSNTTTIYVGPNESARFYVAAQNQPTSVTTACLRVDENLVNSGHVDITVPVMPGQPVDFVSVVPQRP